MKTVYTVILSAMTFNMTSCASSSDKNVVPEIKEAIASKALTKTNKRTIEYSLKNFHGIRNNSNVDIVFKHEKEYSVKVTADETTLKRLMVEVKSGILDISTLNISTEKGRNSDKAYLEISTPELSVIHNNGIADIKAGKLDNSKMNIENNGIINLIIDEIKTNDCSIHNNGQGNIKTTTVVCKLLDYENSGVDKFTASIQADNVRIENNGQEKTNLSIEAKKIGVENNGSMSADIKLNADAVKIDNSGIFKITDGNITCLTLSYENNGSGIFNGRTNANDVDIDNSGIMTTENNIKATKMKIGNNGTLKGKIDFKGEEADIENYGIGNITVNTDCTTLNAHNNGSASLKITGTADRTKIEGNGQSKIDTKELNKF
ncbi:GIN domain-containing protein [Xylanibacter muris]|uniref:Putative auto-transporter adhesin head GIN domain-containing protein n=1 Tax=Xylanibacter muris TaxID=2736290 RepID=A0ABX2ALD5_9BACT|nr:DUF2807 domain-containing protein [Xylanibacter muris]NPD92014.1 hypothetical protein [Xylanibacter muris]